MVFDVLIKNGMVADGTGKRPAFRSDVGVSGDKIFDIGNLAKAKSKIEIDALGQIVSPGFVDIQNHSDSYGGLLSDPHLESMVRQGITTILIGQCGSSLAPLVKGSLASIQKWTEVAGVNINWTSMAEFLETVSRRELGVNLTTLVGHATIRRDFVGESSRPLTPQEERQIAALLIRSLQEGAFGLSIGLAYSHERLAAEEEILRLLRVVQTGGGGVSFHLRNEDTEIYAAVNEVFNFLRYVPVKSKISHLKILGEKNIAGAEKLIRMLEIANRDGAPIYFDVYPYLASATVLYLLLPEWATLGGKAELIKRIKTPAIRQDIIRDMEGRNYPYSKITIASSSLGHNFVGRDIAQIAQDQNVSGGEAILNLLSAARDQVTVFWHDLEEEILEALIKHPLAMVATDGSGYGHLDNQKSSVSHPRSFGSTARVLGRYVREKKILTLEEAVFKMSGRPAEWLGLKNRGVIAKNNFADVVVFDAEKIKDAASYANPYRHPEGISHVIINGKLAVKSGQYQQIPAGRVIRK
ncbi:MAG: amidohydrolase family protein [Parcubacteria group bacterium]|nr:amidohydrolase family protein [Parcubacteria group bacterium]